MHGLEQIKAMNKRATEDVRARLAMACPPDVRINTLRQYDKIQRTWDSPEHINERCSAPVLLELVDLLKQSIRRLGIAPNVPEMKARKGAFEDVLRFVTSGNGGV